MAKTRSQAIKKEEEEDHKDAQLLHSVNNTAGNSSKITKRKSYKNKNKNKRLPDQDIKVEEDTDIKSLLKSTSKYSKCGKRLQVSQEQINQLISAVVNDNMSVNKAARTVKMGYMTAAHYYNQYKNDPEKKIPSPRIRLVQSNEAYTEDQVGNLIRYIVDDNMSVTQASAKVHMHYYMGYYYYKKYLKDPARNIPTRRLCQHYTQDQKNEFFDYIVNNKMSIKAASIKARMNSVTAFKYYHEYFDDQNPNLAEPSHVNTRKRRTKKQKEKR